MRTRRSRSSGSPVPSGKEMPYVVKASQGKHRPVLLHEVVEYLAIQDDDIVLDATLGGAGHAGALAKGLGGNGLFIGFDLDDAALERARDALKGNKPNVHLVAANFRYLERELEKRDIPHITKAFFDLGWSSYQLDSGRGFSFLADEPLQMTYVRDPERNALTAGIIVNTWAESSLADIIYGWGEERYSRRIARAIAERRKKTPFSTSRDLAETIAAATPRAYAYGRLHPATRTFQALRIAVNDELGALKEGLSAAWGKLATGGRIAVITFHSLEDRIVKQQFVAWEKAGEGHRVVNKPVIATLEEIKTNPRARSAKLRVVEKTQINLYESPYSKNQ